jgi:hypothetical protein
LHIEDSVSPFARVEQNQTSAAVALPFAFANAAWMPQRLSNHHMKKSSHSWRNALNYL